METQIKNQTRKVKDIGGKKLQHKSRLNTHQIAEDVSCHFSDLIFSFFKWKVNITEIFNNNSTMEVYK